MDAKDEELSTQDIAAPRAIPLPWIILIGALAAVSLLVNIVLLIQKITS
jgi:hypothetical protein